MKKERAEAEKKGKLSQKKKKTGLFYNIKVSFTARVRGMILSIVVAARGALRQHSFIRTYTWRAQFCEGVGTRCIDVKSRSYEYRVPFLRFQP